MKKLIALIVGASVLLTGCTDAWKGKIKALGNHAHVVCYSGNTKIYDGKSTGKVKSEANSDGYYFIPVGSALPIEVSGNCIITYLSE